jgi:hypothetical protein
VNSNYLWIPKLIILFLLLVISADIFLIYVAESSKSSSQSISRENFYYKQIDGKETWELTYIHRDEKGIPAIAKEVQVELTNKDNNKQIIKLHPVSGITGRYTARTSFCCPEWKAVIHVDGRL